MVQYYSSVTRLATHLVKTVKIRAMGILTNNFFLHKVISLTTNLQEKHNTFQEHVRNTSPFLPAIGLDFA